MKLSPKSSRERWNIPESSVYKAIAKLKELGLIKIKSGKLVIEWIVKSDSELSAPAKDSQLRQKILRSDNQFSAPAKNSQLRQNQSLKSLKNPASDSPQTIQNIQTNQTRAAGENFLENSKADSSKQATAQSSPELTPLSDTLVKTKNLGKDKKEPPNENDSQISSDLKNKLFELEIPLDARVLKAPRASRCLRQRLSSRKPSLRRSRTHRKNMVNHQQPPWRVSLSDFKATH